MGDAHAATHAGSEVNLVHPFIHRERVELAEFIAVAAANTNVLIHPGGVTGACQHQGAVPVRLHGAAAAGAAVANSVKTFQHRFFKEGVVHMSAFVFGFKDLHGFSAGDFPRALGVVFQGETGKGLTTIRQTSSGRQGFSRATRQGQSSATIWSG